MSRKLSTYHSDQGKGYCEVHMNFKEELAYIKYFDNNDRQVFTEDFPNKSVHYVNDAAENWAVGIKKIANGIHH